MRIAFAAVALAAAAATPLIARAPQDLPGIADPSRIPAGTYAIDPGHTQAIFTVLHFGFSDFTGQFGNPSGSITIDPRHPEDAKVDVTFDMNAIHTTVAELDHHMKGPDFFDVAKYPTVRFVSTSVVAKGMKAKITGDLTIKGKTLPITLDAEFVGAGTNPISKKLNFGFKATGVVKRSAYGMTYAVPVVSDDVKLDINAAFTAE
ncbi:MAG: YceI family protein [Pseudomonadota bacterium]